MSLLRQSPELHHHDQIEEKSTTTIITSCQYTGENVKPDGQQVAESETTIPGEINDIEIPLTSRKK